MLFNVINAFAFEYARNLTTVTITSPITHLGEEAFSHTSITSFTIPETVTSMDKLIFAGRETALDAATDPITFAGSGTWAIRRQDNTEVNLAYTPAKATYITYFTYNDDDHGGYYWTKNA